MKKRRVCFAEESYRGGDCSESFLVCRRDDKDDFRVPLVVPNISDQIQEHVVSWK